MHIELSEWNQLNSEVRELTASLMNEYHDTPISSLFTASEILEHLIADSLIFWVVYVDDECAGLFALSTYAERPDYVECTTILWPSYRGTGVNSRIKRATAQAMHAAQLPFAAQVREWNIRSQRALAKAFPNVQFEPALSKGENAYFCDLSNVSLELIAEEDRELFDSVFSWASSHSKAQ